LACRNAPFSSSKTDQIGKRAADIDRHENHAILLLWRRWSCSLNWA
jgi:hypothetical protein